MLGKALRGALQGVGVNLMAFNLADEQSAPAGVTILIGLRRHVDDFGARLVQLRQSLVEGDGHRRVRVQLVLKPPAPDAQAGQAPLLAIRHAGQG